MLFRRQDVGCGFELSAGPEYCGRGRGGRPSRQTVIDEWHMLPRRHDSSFFFVLPQHYTISSCRAVRKVVCWGSPLKTVHSFKLLPPHLDYMSWQHFHHVYRLDFISACGMPYPRLTRWYRLTAIIPNYKCFHSSRQQQQQQFYYDVFLSIIACIIILLGIFQTENTIYVNDAHCLFLPALGFLRALLMLYLHCFAHPYKYRVVYHCVYRAMQMFDGMHGVKKQHLCNQNCW